MSEIAGPIKELKLNLPELKRRPDEPRISHTPLVHKVTDFHKWVVATVASGFTYKETARMLGCSEGYVSEINNWRHPVLDMVKQGARERMMNQVEDLSTLIGIHAKEALQTTVSIMKGEFNAGVPDRRLAAKDILDRAGYAPVKKTADVTAAVPSHEFVTAVERMARAEEAAERAGEWKWQPPVAVIEGASVLPHLATDEEPNDHP